MISFFGTFFTIPLAGANGSEMTPAVPVFMLSFMLPFIIFGAIFIGGALFVIYGLIGAILVFQGNDFPYIYK